MKLVHKGKQKSNQFKRKNNPKSAYVKSSQRRVKRRKLMG